MENILQKLDLIPSKYFPNPKMYRLTVSKNQERIVVGKFRSLKQVDNKIMSLGCPLYFIEEIDV